MQNPPPPYTFAPNQLSQGGSMSGKVYLVDGSSYIFRAFYAVAPLTSSKGLPTNAVFGFARMLLKLLSEPDADHLMMVFDAGKETFRNALYPQYKANRKDCPPELLRQMPYFRELSMALGLQIAELPGFEADDIIGTLARRLQKAGSEVVIVSSDKDLMQLIGGGVSMWDTMQDRHFGEKEVAEKLGVPPCKVIEYLGLTGDSSDNVPGLSGVGPKTACQLIEKYGDVDTIIASAAEIGEDKSLRNRLKISKQIELDSEILRLSRQLVEVDCNTPVRLCVAKAEVGLEQLNDEQLMEAIRRKDPDRDRLLALVEELEFTSLFKDLDLTPPSVKQDLIKDFNYSTVYRGDFAAWFAEFAKQSAFALDLETTSLNVLEAEIVGFAFCWADREAFYIPVGHHGVEGADQQITVSEVLENCAAALKNPAVKKCGQNLKYDISVLARHGVEVEGIGFDSMVADYLLHPDRASHSLTTLVKEYLALPVTEYAEVTKDKQDFSTVAIDEATRYSGQDAHYAWLLSIKLGELLSQEGLADVFFRVELPLVPVLSRMELSGVRIDAGLLERMSVEIAAKLKAIESRLYETAGCEFNLNSPKQLSEVLFGKLGISTKGVKKTKTGISTDSSVLEKLGDQHPLPRMILEYRQLHKLKSTYVDALPVQISPLTGRLHTRFNQTVTGTGRLSSSDPNLQNIPVQGEEGRKIRSAFVAEPGRVLVSADYSQIELRVLAHMSGDPNLIAAFREGRDIHAETARELLRIPQEESVTAEQRRIGKTLNFGVIYGMSGFRLGRELGIPVAVAAAYIDNYFRHYHGVSRFFAELEETAGRQGFVSTMFGRRRVIADIDTGGRDQGFLRRVAVNAPIQGTAADIIKLAMIRLDRLIRGGKLPIMMILQIHDELVFECLEEFKEEAVQIARREMCSAAELKVPLEVDVQWGYNWESAH